MPGIPVAHTLWWKSPSDDSQPDSKRYETMNRNADLSYDGRWDRTNISVRQLHGLNSQRRKSQGPEAAPIAHGRAPDPDRSQPGRHALAHREPFSGSFPTRRLVHAPSRTPTSIAFPAVRPEPALNSNCSLVTSGRGAISPCSSFDSTPLTAQQQNSISCTPPRQRERGRMPRDP